jgi:NAD(P)-dependent dehydrogenase (short-subunit alcohol dehydrogenase family)
MHPPLPGLALVAHRGLPRSEAYGASKAAIMNLFESKQMDLMREGIRVAVGCPGLCGHH